jgi:hypothetical protein
MTQLKMMSRLEYSFFFFSQRRLYGQNTQEKKLTSLDIREIQIKTIMRYSTSNRLSLRNKKEEETRVGEDVGKVVLCTLLIRM